MDQLIANRLWNKIKSMNAGRGQRLIAEDFVQWRLTSANARGDDRSFLFCFL